MRRKVENAGMGEAPSDPLPIETGTRAMLNVVTMRVRGVSETMVKGRSGLGNTKQICERRPAVMKSQDAPALLRAAYHAPRISGVPAPPTISVLDSLRTHAPLVAHLCHVKTSATPPVAYATMAIPRDRLILLRAAIRDPLQPHVRFSLPVRFTRARPSALPPSQSSTNPDVPALAPLAPEARIYSQSSINSDGNAFHQSFPAPGFGVQRFLRGYGCARKWSTYTRQELDEAQRTRRVSVADDTGGRVVLGSMLVNRAGPLRRRRRRRPAPGPVLPGRPEQHGIDGVEDEDVFARTEGAAERPAEGQRLDGHTLAEHYDRVANGMERMDLALGGVDLFLLGSRDRGDLLSRAAYSRCRDIFSGAHLESRGSRRAEMTLPASDAWKSSLTRECGRYEVEPMGRGRACTSGMNALAKIVRRPGRRARAGSAGGGHRQRVRVENRYARVGDMEEGECLYAASESIKRASNNGSTRRKEMARMAQTTAEEGNTDEGIEVEAGNQKTLWISSTATTRGLPLRRDGLGDCVSSSWAPLLGQSQALGSAPPPGRCSSDYNHRLPFATSAISLPRRRGMRSEGKREAVVNDRNRTSGHRTYGHGLILRYSVAKR
ncbi:hypothetical protein C8R44DRAFT_745794 [Mycena epipterygia]|nr:hypothetical protein C8R44DRAFT_745794 [Mycena epipterygia]